MVAEERSSRPPSSTTTWSLTRSSSPSRCEVTSTAMPNSCPIRCDQRQHVVARGRVEAVGRLVEQHQPRVVHQRLGELGPLLHAGGVAAHRPVPLLGQPHVAQHVGGPLARRGVGQPGHLAHVHDEVAGGDVGRAGSRARACSRPARGSRPPSVATSWPSTVAVPLVAGTSPSRILISVDLPAPLAPTSPVTPSPTVTSRWSSAVTAGTASSAPRSRSRPPPQPRRRPTAGRRTQVCASASLVGPPLASDHEQTGRRRPGTAGPSSSRSASTTRARPETGRCSSRSGRSASTPGT